MGARGVDPDQVTDSPLVYGKLEMSRLGGGPFGLPLAPLALSSNIITLRERQRKRERFYLSSDMNSPSAWDLMFHQNSEIL